MPLIKVKGKGQMTIPAEIRSTLKLSEGDVLEAEIEEGRIVLTPKVVMDRAAFFRELDEMAARAESSWRAQGLSDEEVERLIEETVEEVRAERYERGEQSR